MGSRAHSIHMLSLNPRILVGCWCCCFKKLLLIFLFAVFLLLKFTLVYQQFRYQLIVFVFYFILSILVTSYFFKLNKMSCRVDYRFHLNWLQSWAHTSYNVSIRICCKWTINDFANEEERKWNTIHMWVYVCVCVWVYNTINLNEEIKLFTEQHVENYYQMSSGCLFGWLFHRTHPNQSKPYAL